MAETAEKTVINSENYNRIFNLLTCNDEPSINLGYTLLENVDFQESKIYVYCLLNQINKRVTNFGNLLKDKAPLLVEKMDIELKEYNTTTLDLSFRKIYEIALSKEDNKEELLFLINLFSNELKEVLINYGFSFLEYFDVIVKPKENE